MDFEQLKQFKKENAEKEQLEKELEDLYDKDQADRMNGLFSTDEGLFLQNEEERAKRAREIYQLYQKGEIVLSPLGCNYLAMLFHHRTTPEDYKIVYELAQKAAEGGVLKARWLQSAAEDRYLLSIGQKQK